MNRLLGPTQRGFRRCESGFKNVISNKPPSDADAAGSETTLSDHGSKGPIMVF